MSHTDVGRLHVAAPREAVFAALVDGDARAAWLPPAGMTGRVAWFDARPGGGYRMTLAYDDPATPGKAGDGTASSRSGSPSSSRRPVWSRRRTSSPTTRRTPAP